MYFIQAGGLAALAGLSQAFLIPPSMSGVSTKVAATIPFEAQAEVKGAGFMIDCPGCPVALSKDSDVVSHAQSKLKIDFAVQKNAGLEDSLLINGISVLPTSPSAASGGMHADQLVQDPEGRWVPVSNPELGYFLRIRPFHDRTHPDLTAYNVHLRIKEVANELVRRVPAIDVKVIKTADGTLMIANSHVGHAPERPHHEIVAVVSEPECNSMFCRWKVTFFEKYPSLRKGCGRKGGPMRHPRPNGIFKTGPHGRPRPAGFEHRRPSHHRHGDRYQLTVGRVIHDLFWYVVVPMIVGAAMGFAVGIIGLVTGTMIILLWRVLFRRGQRGQCNKQHEESQKGVDEEKTGLMEDQEAPPVYEDVIVAEDEKAEQK